MTDCTATPYPKRKKNKFIEDAEAKKNRLCIFIEYGEEKRKMKLHNPFQRHTQQNIYGSERVFVKLVGVVWMLVQIRC